MTTLFARMRFVIAVFAVFGLLGLAQPAAAQQPDPVNPTARSVQEDQLLQQLRKIDGRGSIPNVTSYTIEQPAGRDWRHFHEVTLRWIGEIAILGMLALVVIFYAVRGTIRLASGRSGRKVRRFNGFERFVHWLTATCFIILALSGLNITFGKLLLLPLIGPESFTAFSQWASYAHNYLSF